MTKALYPPLKPQETGLKGRCPRCGQGALFDGFLTIGEQCKSCKLSYSFADAGDGPAFFVSSLGMIPAVAFVLWMEFSVGAPYWLNALLTVPVLFAVCVLPLRPLKGYMVALQYVKDAHQGRIDGHSGAPD